MKRTGTSILLLLLFAFLHNGTHAQQKQTAVTEKINDVIGGYYESLPNDYHANTEKRYPLLIALHGIGEVGNGTAAQLPKLLNGGIPKVINQKKFPSVINIGGESFSFIVISPQLTDNHRNATIVSNIIDYCIKKYRVDPTRIYLTGLSMGGGISWIYAGSSKANADRLAGLLVVCGNTQANAAGSRNIIESGLPVWITHNYNDGTVPTSNSTGWYKNLIDGGLNPTPILEIFEVPGHDAWTTTYDKNHRKNGLNVYEWLLTHKRTSAAAVDLPPVVNAGVNQSVTPPANTVTLKGAVTGGATVVSYKWEKISGPEASISSPSTLTTTVTGLTTAGTYTFQLTVTDSKGVTGIGTVSVKVNSAAGDAVSDCNCTDFLEPTNNSIYVNGEKYAPGSVLCIRSGTYESINLQNFNGTAQSPLVIKNCGGQVYVTGRNYGISVSKSSHFKFVGIGAPNIKYGFKVEGTTVRMSSGIGISNQTTDFEISNMEFAKTGVGVICKTNPTCDETTWGGNFTMRNVVMHDIYVHDVDGEGFYVGHTSLTSEVTCGGELKNIPTQTIENLKIYNNITENTGWDGIQVAAVPVNCEVYNNTIKNYGTANLASQQMGLLFGGYSSGKAYNNYIEKGTGSGLMILGIGEVTAFNNLLVDCGENAAADGIYIDDRPVPGKPVLKVNLVNNTVIRPGRSAVRIENSQGTLTEVHGLYNNLLIHPEARNNEAFFSLRSGAKGRIEGNILLNKVEDAGFVNAGDKNFLLAPASVAIDTGVDVATYGVLHDMRGGERKLGRKVDAGTYEFGAAEVKINNPPIVSAGVGQAIDLPENTVTFKASAVDTDGLITSYNWTKISGPAAKIAAPDGAVTNITELVEGSYVFQLTVTDNAGASASSLVTVTVNKASNLDPVVSAGSSQSIVLPTNTVTLRGEATDQDGSIVAYNWTKASGPAATITNPAQATTTVTGLVEGEYIFRLTATDNGNAEGTAVVMVTVKAIGGVANKAPVANAGTNQIITLPQSSVTLSGSGTDQDGSISSYTWTKVSGPEATITNSGSAVTSVTGLTHGVYVFRLTVTDDKGATGSATVTVTVNTVANQAPVANAGADQTITLPLNSVTLSGSGIDTDGRVTGFQWEKISGPEATITSDKEAITSVTGLVEGVYAFRLTVTDDRGATGRATVTVTVKAEPTDADLALSVMVYPNPTAQEVKLLIDSKVTGTTILLIYDRAGKLVQKTEFVKDVTSVEKIIDMTNFVKGVYTIQVLVDFNLRKSVSIVRN